MVNMVSQAASRAASQRRWSERTVPISIQIGAWISFVVLLLLL